MVDPVEEQINFMIDEIDAMVTGKYPFKLRDILEHPLDYKERPTIFAELEKLKMDVTEYFERRKADLADGTRLYMEDAAKASNVAKRMEEDIVSAAKTAKKPVVKPLTFARKDEEDEILFVEKYEDSYAKVIQALVDNCLFVVDSCIQLDGFKVGRWVFPDSSGKNRAIFISFPINPAGAFDIARDQMLLALDAVKSEVMTQLSLEGKPLPIAPKPIAPAGKAEEPDARGGKPKKGAS